MSASADALLGAPLFVVGCPGAGTGVVGDILGSHGRVAYCDDPPAIARYYPRLLRDEVSTAEARAFYLDACRRWLATRSPAPIQRFALRCPGHALVVPFLAREFPDARIVHVLRDGRAVVPALLRGPAGGGEGRGTGGPGRRADDWLPAGRRVELEAATAAERAALTWIIHVSAGLEGRAVAPDRYFEVRYEDLLADPAGWGGRVLAFTGVEMEPPVEVAL